MKTSESIIKITTAYLKAQKEIGAAKKGASNPFFHSKYADLGSVMEACKEALNNNEITVLQPVMGTMLETVLVHSSGEWFASETPIVCKEQNNPQALGSAISYARRYGLQSMVFIPAEDDDGNTASKGGTAKATARPYYAKVEQKVVVPGIETGATMKATEKQVQLISILLGKKGRTDEELKKKYKVESKKDLTMVQASQIIENLNSLPDVDAQGEIL